MPNYFTNELIFLPLMQTKAKYARIKLALKIKELQHSLHSQLNNQGEHARSARTRLFSNTTT